MRKLMALLLIVPVAVATQGCGNSDTQPAAQSATQSGSAANQSLSASPAAPSPADAEIVQVANSFLEAIRAGNSAQATAQLTPAAQQVMQQQDMGFELLASSTASFQVQSVEHVQDDEVGVNSVWTEVDEAGQPMQEQWTLGLQRIDGQWRVRGIIADMGQNQPPMMMDFEDPGQAAAPAAAAPANTASVSPAGNGVPQQAARPATQDPFRQ